MITESVRTILGPDLTGQVEAALKGKGKDGKDIDIVVGNDGTFVPAEKFNGATSGRTSAENALKAAAEALKAIGGSGDPAKIADDVKNAQTTLETLRTDHQKEINRIQKNTALRLALDGKVHDPADIISLLDQDKIEVDDTGTLKTDLDGLLKPIRESKPYLFKSQEPDKNTQPQVKGAKPADPGARQEPAANADGPVVI